jgi:hypothetical protein
MRAVFLATAFLASVLASCGATAFATQFFGSRASATADTPVVEANPRAPDFFPNPQVNRAELQWAFTYDDNSESTDEKLDRTVGIYRC